MSDEVLKPCPICGKKVSIARTDNEVGERWWFITRGTYRTTRCNCRLFLKSEKFTCGWNDDYALECRAKLIDKWNTRANLGSGTLTAEQVREAIEDTESELLESCEYVGGMGQRKADVVKAFDKMKQAIADELNDELGSGTCRNQWQWDSGFCCSECFYTVPFVGKFVSKAFRYCPNCGRKVVSA